VQSLHDVPAPAKLNLFLHVVGRRADGYHLLQTVFRFVDLCDLLHFELTPDGRVVREGDGLAGLSPDDDLVVRAARALRVATGARYGVRIRYEKRIPAGGGLGGGSSDAASTLVALNRLWGTGLRRAELGRLAVTLGADVPIFVFGQPAFAQGIGEELTAVTLPDCAYWIVQPRAQVSTREIFADPDLTRNSESVKIAVFTDWQKGRSGLFGRNDLEAIVFRRHPAVSRVAQVMREAGLEVRMTGSGGCLFAPFENLADARLQQDRIISKISSLPGGAVGGSWVCRGLADHPLRGWIVD
jgi:4-diphosphocytidyl-2-C-methyl-D-erythritol kinase